MRHRPSYEPIPPVNIGRAASTTMPNGERASWIARGEETINAYGAGKTLGRPLVGWL